MKSLYFVSVYYVLMYNIVRACYKITVWADSTEDAINIAKEEFEKLHPSDEYCLILLYEVEEI